MVLVWHAELHLISLSRQRNNLSFSLHELHLQILNQFEEILVALFQPRVLQLAFHMRELVYWCLLGDLLDTQLLLDSPELLVPLFHGVIFASDLVDLIFKLAVNLCWQRCLSASLGASLLLHELVNPAEFGSHLDDFAFKQILFQLERSIFPLEVVDLVRLVGAVFGRWQVSFRLRC